MEMIISTGLSLLANVAPSLSGTTAIGSAIKFLAAAVPVAVKVAKNEIPIIKGIIATLRRKSVTAEQMAELDALDAQCDAVLDAAIRRAEAEDAAAEAGAN